MCIRDRAIAHLLGAAEAFRQAPPDAIRARPASADDRPTHRPTDTSAAATIASSSSASSSSSSCSSSSEAGGKAGVPAVAAGWGKARSGPEELLLAVLRSLVQSSKGCKRHGAHRELYSMALRSLKQTDAFGACLRELETAARASHVVR